MGESLELWRDPVFDERHSHVPRSLVERLASMADETAAGRIGRHVYYERLHALLAVASIARSVDTGTFNLEEPPSEAEKRLGVAVGQALHQGCGLTDVALAADSSPDRVIAIGRRTLRRTKWIGRL